MDRFKFVAAVYVLFERDGKVLLMRRHNTGWANGWFTLPAGHVDQGEHLVEAAVREAREETGVSVAVEDMTLFHVSHSVYGPNDQCLDFFFRAQKWTGDFCNNEPDKCDLMDWYPRSALPEKLLRNVRAALGSPGGLGLQEFPLLAEEGMAILKA
ncbi:MAG: NUDIX domain-containing protein [Pseudomonadota bacterium]|nr:NUDIX domain-containing protein [Pseudomonadota bacterium]